MFMLFGFGGLTMSPRTNYFQFWDHQVILNNSRRIPDHLEKYSVLRNPNIEFLDLLAKKRSHANPEDPADEFLGILNMESRYLEKHEMKIRYRGWDPYFRET